MHRAMLDMNPDRWAAIDRLYRAAAELPAESRPAYIRDMASDPQIAEEVISLLEHSSTDDLLETDATGPVGNVLDLAASFEQPPLRPGERIHRYIVQGLLGRGGMSAVYAAEQDTPRRTVAIKIPLTGGLGSRSAARRFLDEAMYLGKLRHEGIAQIFEAGLHEVGDQPPRPFIAMEFVPDAVRITDYCRQRDLSLQSRLGLFVRVCRALHHGHQRGIIHYDVKPSNILIDSGGNPKLIDFGVSRTTEPIVRDSASTGGGREVAGTFQYMSPEQREANPLLVDIRTDVYSLGVVLYETIAGVLPAHVKDQSSPPAAPHTGEMQVPPLQFRGHPVDVDLATIVSAAMEKDPDRRYQSAADLAADLEAFLSTRPLIGRPPGVGRRMRLFIRRHPRACLAAGVVAAVLALAAIQISRSNIAARRADQTATTLLSLMNDMLSSPRMRGNANVRVVELLDDSAARLDSLSALPLDAAERMRATLAESYDLVGLYSEARGQFEIAVELATRAYGPDDSRTIDRIRGLAGSCFDLGLFDDALGHLDAIMPMVQARDGAQSLQAARLLNEYGLIRFFKGEYAVAEALHTRVLEIRRRLCGPDSLECAQALHNVAVDMIHQGRSGNAKPLLAEAMRISLSHPSTLDAQTPRVRRWLAIILAEEGKLSEAQEQCDLAITELRGTVGEDHPFMAGVLDACALIAAARGNHAAAEQHLRRAVDLCTRAHGPDHPYTRSARARLADLLAGRSLHCPPLRESTPTPEDAATVAHGR